MKGTIVVQTVFTFSAVGLAWFLSGHILLNKSDMSNQRVAEPSDFESWITSTLEPHNLTYKPNSSQILQRLWAGYGSIYKISATSSNTPRSLICKVVSPPKTKDATPGESYLRKILSYQAEAFFYQQLAHRLPSEIAVAEYITSGSQISSSSWHLVISDLKPDFPFAGEKRGALSKVQVESAIDWIAGFHGFWWHRDQIDTVKQLVWVDPPLKHWQQYSSKEISKPGLWRNGGYTYLETRRSEFASLRYGGGEWPDALCDERAIAEKVARFLARDSEYHTLIHGDVKSENLCTSQDGKSVAFYDFQYVGNGLGVCDLAKLFTCSVPSTMLEDRNGEELGMSDGEKRLLERYVKAVEERSAKKYDFDVLVRHWETALVDWLRFQASWGFWGNTQWLEGRVRRILKDEGWLKWLEDELEE